MAGICSGDGAAAGRSAGVAQQFEVALGLGVVGDDKSLGSFVSAHIERDDARGQVVASRKLEREKRADL